MTISEPPVEADRRRLDWRPGTPLTLLDGKVWHLPAPTLQHTALVGPGGAVILPYLDLGGLPAGEPPFSVVVDDALQTIAGAGDDVVEWYIGITAFVMARLQVNYDLTDVEIVRLLMPATVEIGERDETRRAILGIVQVVERDISRLLRAYGRVEQRPDPSIN